MVPGLLDSEAEIQKIYKYIVSMGLVSNNILINVLFSILWNLIGKYSAFVFI